MLLTSSWRAAGLAFSAAALLYAALALYSSDHLSLPQYTYNNRPVIQTTELPAFESIIEYFVDFPIRSPFKDGFGELGRRSRILRDWLLAADKLPLASPERTALEAASEEVGLSLFPFLANYTPPARSPNETLPDNSKPLSNLRASFDRGSAGIVIPAGNKNVRFAAHLIGSLQLVLGSALPIQVAYAGDDDLSADNRNKLSRVGNASMPIEFFDLSTVFAEDDAVPVPKKKEPAANDDEQEPIKREPLQAPFFCFRDLPSGGGWALKSFAALASRFEKVILLDADAVFVQLPETMLADDTFVDTGALLFRDRLLWQNDFPRRHEWWHDQIRRPSLALNDSLVWNEAYAEEGDSGVVVLDKGRLDVLIGLLHTCWQNTFAVREEVTYKMLYGDKESWWMGLELAGATYTMEKHYGAMVGWAAYDPKVEEEEKNGTAVESRTTHQDGDKSQTVNTADRQADPGADEPPPNKVCSFVIAHIDRSSRLLWFNGSLLKNKSTFGKGEYEVPRQWMMDGKWEKGAMKKDMSCMRDAAIHELDEDQVAVLQRLIGMAQTLDRYFVQ